jgi:2-haloacid dehalogenase
VSWLLFDLNGTLLDPGDEAESKLEATGIRAFFDFVAGTDEVEAFKPDPRVYALGLERAGSDDVWMVAAHAWDLMGAARAGMRTAYLARLQPWPGMLDEPAAQAPDLEALASVL